VRRGLTICFYVMHGADSSTLICDSMCPRALSREGWDGFGSVVNLFEAVGPDGYIGTPQCFGFVWQYPAGLTSKIVPFCRLAVSIHDCVLIFIVIYYITIVFMTKRITGSHNSSLPNLLPTRRFTTCVKRLRNGGPSKPRFHSRKVTPTIK